MKFFIVKEGQSAELLATRVAASGGLARLQALNPHLDLQRLAPGNVLIWPADSDDDDSESVAGRLFDGFAADVRAGLRTATTRVRGGLARQEEQRKEAAAVFRSAAFKRAVETDAELREQATAADSRAKLLQGRAKEIDAALLALDRTAEQGLAALAKVLK
jgi:hypothetical protein